MNDIKFRAWHIKLKKWDYFTLQDLIDYGSAVRSEFDEGDHENWCQYIGVKDKNSKEIYDGDIVRTIGEPGDGTPCEVRFSEGCFWLFGWHGCRIDNFEMEVIGNIYQNPDLVRS